MIFHARSLDVNRSTLAAGHLALLRDLPVLALAGVDIAVSADQSEAGFAEAQLAAYGFRPFGFTGSCAIAWREHTAARVWALLGWSVVGRRTPRVKALPAVGWRGEMCVCVVCGAWCGCVRTGMAWSGVFMRLLFADAVSFVASGGCSLRNACMVGAWCVSLRDLARSGCVRACVLVPPVVGLKWCALYHQYTPEIMCCNTETSCNTL